MPPTTHTHRADVDPEDPSYAAPAMIYPHSNETQTQWDRGELHVQLVQPNNPRPVGFCDGTPADLAELRELAESEGADDFKIDRKVLKTGREIWTVSG